MNGIQKLQAVLRRIGSYRCSHVSVQQASPEMKRKACCSEGDEFVPVCGLTNQPCVGLPQCPRLDVATKSELIKKWNDDIKKKSTIDPLEVMRSK